MVNKKKRDRPDVQELIDRPWCYYCERDFDDQKVLISHQKAKHFKCDKCNRRLNTAGGLQVHLQQVHKETLTAVDNAIEGRQNVEPEVFGMMGIPDELVEAHKQRILNEFFKQEADRRALTGNPPPGQGEPNAKKRKMETPEELKARLAEHRAKRAAERQAEKEGKVPPKSTSNTPDPTQSKVASGGRDPMSQPQTSFDGTHPALSQFPPPHPGLPLQSPVGPGFPPPFPPHQPGQWPPHMAPPSFSPPQAVPYATPPFMPPARSPMTAQMPNAVVSSHIINRPPVIQPAALTAARNLQPAPGLPARPSFDLPNFNREDMQRMHTGQVPPPGNTAGPSRPATKKLTYDEHMLEDVEKMLKAAKDDFHKECAIQVAFKTFPTKKPTDPIPAALDGTADAPVESKAPAATTNDSGASKKKKGKPFTLVYNDDHECPEEKKAKWGKYAFKLDRGPDFVEGEIGGAVTGVPKDEDTVLDVQD